MKRIAIFLVLLGSSIISIIATSASASMICKRCIQTDGQIGESPGPVVYTSYKHCEDFQESGPIDTYRQCQSTSVQCAELGGGDMYCWNNCYMADECNVMDVCSPGTPGCVDWLHMDAEQLRIAMAADRSAALREIDQWLTYLTNTRHIETGEQELALLKGLRKSSDDPAIESRLLADRLRAYVAKVTGPITTEDGVPLPLDRGSMLFAPTLKRRIGGLLPFETAMLVMR